MSVKYHLTVLVLDCRVFHNTVMTRRYHYHLFRAKNHLGKGGTTNKRW